MKSIINQMSKELDKLTKTLSSMKKDLEIILKKSSEVKHEVKPGDYGFKVGTKRQCFFLNMDRKLHAVYLDGTQELVTDHNKFKVVKNIFGVIDKKKKASKKPAKKVGSAVRPGIKKELSPDSQEELPFVGDEKKKKKAPKAAKTDEKFNFDL